VSADRILLVVDGLRLGGTERQVVQLIRGLRRRGRYPVVLAVLDAGGALHEAAADGATVTIPVRRRVRFDATVAPALWWYARRTGVRAIHAIGWMSGLAGLGAARAAGLPVVNGAIRSAPRTLDWRDRISRWSAVHSDAIVANSRAGLEAYGVAEDRRSRVIENGIDVDRLLAIDASPRNRPTICMVANFNRYKDHQTLLRAVPAIRAEIPDVEVILVGHDGGTLAAARALVRDLRVDPSVTIIENCAEPERFVASTHVAVLASHVEGFSTAMLEYMALGKPVVASDTCGDVASLVREARAGVTYTHRSPEELAAGVVRLLRDPLLSRAMGESGRLHAASFTIERMAKAYEAVYTEVLRR